MLSKTNSALLSPEQSSLEGVVKYHCNHTHYPHLVTLLACCSLTGEQLRTLPRLDAARTILKRHALIGVTAEGIGYGNLSYRIGNGAFIISGSGTGNRTKLGPDGYSLVQKTDPASNTVWSQGPIQASSEAMTHDAIYRACAATCVIHVHSQLLFRRFLNSGALQTPIQAAYGTPALSEAVFDIVRQSAQEKGFLVTAGHENGLFIFGMTIRETLRITLNLLGDTVWRSK